MIRLNLLAEWGALFNQTQELDPFLMTVLRPKHVHDLASEHIHRGEQSSRSVALIIVGLGRTMVPAAQVKPGCVRLNAWI